MRNTTLTPNATQIEVAAFRRQLQELGFPQGEIDDEVQRVITGNASAVLVERDDGSPRLFCGEPRTALYGDLIANDPDDDGTPHWKWRIGKGDVWSADSYPTKHMAEVARRRAIARERLQEAHERFTLRETPPAYCATSHNFPFEEEDYILTPTGYLGGRILIVQVGSSRPCEDFADMDEALDHVRCLMDGNAFWPSVWWLSDHGNAWRIDPETGDEIR